MRQSILLIFLLTFNLSAISQKIHVSGIIKDKNSNTIINSAVICIKNIANSDSILLTADTIGVFNIENLRYSKFYISISHVGYNVFWGEYDYPNDSKIIEIGTIFLTSIDNELKNVIVQAKVPAIVFKEDTVEYKADSFHVKENSNIEELLKKLPGIKVNRDGSILVNGKIVTNIKINGKDYLEGNNKSITQNLPASIVDKVQVIDDYGEVANFSKFKIGEADKIINIELKKDKSNGYFEKTQIGGSLNNNYILSNSFNYFNNFRQVSIITKNDNINGDNVYSSGIPFVGSLGSFIGKNNSFIENQGGTNSITSLIKNQDYGFVTAVPEFSSGITKNNYYGIRYSESKWKKLNYYVSYLYYNKSNVLTYAAVGRQFFNGYYLGENQSTDNNIKLFGHRLFLNIEYKPTPSFSIKLMPKYTPEGSIKTMTNSQTQSLYDSTINVGKSVNNLSLNKSEYSIGLIIKKKFEKSKSVLFLESNYNNYNSNNNVTSLYTFSNNFIDTTNQKNLSFSKNTFFESKLEYVLPITANLSNESYYDYKSLLNSSNKLTSFNKNNFYVLDSDYSGNIYSQNYFNTIGSNFKLKINKTEYVIGLGVQNIKYKRQDALSNFKKSNFTLLPVAQIRFSPNKTRSLVFQYSGIVQPPTSLMLQPISDSSNPFYVYKGNIQLKSEFKNNASLSYYNFDYSLGGLFLAYLSISKTFNKIIQSIELDQTGKTYISPINTDYNSDITFYYNFSKPFKNKKYELTIAGNVSKIQYNFFNNGLININKYIINQNVEFTYNKNWGEFIFGSSIKTNQFKIGKDIESTIDYTCQNSTNIFFDKYKVGYNLTFTQPLGYLFLNNRNSSILNAFVEKDVLKNKVILKIEGVDIFNQSKINYYRNLNDNSFMDYKYSTLGRYVILSIVFKLSRFGK